MTVVYGDYHTVKGLLAGEDLSSYQYCPVKAASTAGEVIKCAAVTDKPLGILMNDPTDGQPAIIAVSGVVKAKVTPSDVAVGDYMGVDSTGRLRDTANDNRPIIGVALTPSTAAGDLIQVAIHPVTRY